MFEENIYCRACNSENLIKVLDLGYIFPSTFITGIEYLERSPLVLAKCGDCELVQLKHTVNMDSMYRKYWYKSGINVDMRKALMDIVNNITSRIDIKDNDVILDIGCNDGTMFDYYPNYVIKVGFDPAFNLAREAKNHCDIFINDYFSAEKFPSLSKRAKIVTTIAMMYDLPDPNKFVEDIKSVLDVGGLWVSQFTDLLTMLRLNEFTTICHEHLEYYSIEWIIEFLKRHGLEVWDIQRNDVNGGSVRFYISYPSVFTVTPSVTDFLNDEKKYMSSFKDPIVSFAERVETVRHKFMTFLNESMITSKTVMGLGASTKANTLLQYFGVNDKLISCIGEVSKDKFGLKTVGTNIPIVPEGEVLKAKPYCIVVFTWQFKSFFMNLLKDYIQNDGNVLFPLPNPEIINKSGVQVL